MIKGKIVVERDDKNLDKYPIKEANNDFKFSIESINAKGSRIKRTVIDCEGKIAFFKYQGDGYEVSEACSEKMCYEIANILGYPCARIELAVDENGQIGVLNYLFNDKNMEHMDAVVYLNTDNSSRKEFYTLTNIKETLDNLDKKLYKEFIKLMIFDALVGEQDRHEENWGITTIDNLYQFSPLYDNGCSLLREFKNEELAKKYYLGIKNFDAYINRSKTCIYIEDNKKCYRHFDLIKYLYKDYSELIESELMNLSQLTDELISNIVEKIPDELITDQHKEFIKIYLQKRRDILLNIKEM